MSHLDADLKIAPPRRSGDAHLVSQVFGSIAFMPRRIFYRLLVSALVGVVALYVWRRR
ncbi:hypothetical protein LG047_07360 [Methylocystis sp. WRRC1]|uniref:hypothetical protein n=1 Tax=Methylocystis sp. WRRC1 TaxID=1732014 RepID=UPI001D14B72B|nr:hypothetical protein [Methylocystis sp. WRRC1]MCC3245136.1 hypothetical protein [Methylocystis sp. WRRC1]